MKRIIKPPNINHYSFIMHDLKKEWGKLNYIRIGKNPKNKEYVEWCENNTMDEFYHSIGYEVFYFKNILDLAFFKLTWGHKL